jgi:hypothetical protein
VACTCKDMDMDMDGDCINQALSLGMGRAIPRERNTSTIATSTWRLLCFFVSYLILGFVFLYLVHYHHASDGVQKK